jgi:hypothetical protein
MLKEGGSMRN